MPGLGASFGRGGATNFLEDLANSDCIVIEGSNMAECHPVGFQWVMEAKARGAKIVHIDPRFTRTSAVADLHVPLRVGTDIAFLGGLINYVLDNDLYFKEYVVAYTNAATLVGEDFVDTEDLDGLFSGFDAENRQYDERQLAVRAGGADALGRRAAGRGRRAGRSSSDHPDVKESDRAQAAGSGGPPIPAKPKRDETLQHPRWVFQILKRHFARYTPEMVSEVCGIEPEVFQQVAEWVTENSNRDRTTAWVYAVGWTQHSVGAQYIRTASILQTLLGNIGRPGGGIMALRGHASIQGSTDIPTLYNLLPGYLPMPHALQHQTLDEYVRRRRRQGRLLGQQARLHGQPAQGLVGRRGDGGERLRFDYLPKINGDHSSYRTIADMIEGKVSGYFLVGENPAVGHPNGRMNRFGLANLDWLVVRDLQMIESATFWKDGAGDRDRASWPRRRSAPRSSSCRRPRTWRRTAPSPRPSGCCSGGTRRSSRRTTPAATCGSTTTSAGSCGSGWRTPPTRATARCCDLTWDYPVHGETQDPDAEAVLREINGIGPDGARAVVLHADEGRRLDHRRLLDLHRRLRRRGQPGRAAQAGQASRARSPPSGAGRGR